MNHSEQIDKIAPALLAAQQNLKPVPRSAENPHYRSKFAPLGEVMAAAQVALHGERIAVLQSTDAEDDSGFNVVTTLLHTSGQWISGRVRIPLEGATAQKAGSAITYGRRYGLAALLGIVADDDDDAQAASAPTPVRSAPSATGTKPKKTLKERTEVELLELRAWAERAGKADLVERINDEMERRHDAPLDEVPPELER